MFIRYWCQALVRKILKVFETSVGFLGWFLACVVIGVFVNFLVDPYYEPLSWFMITRTFTIVVSTVPLNYNFIFTCVSMRGAMRNLQISLSRVCMDHVFSWRGTFTSRVICRMLCVEQPRMEQPCCNSHTKNTRTINMHCSIAINF